MLVLGLSTIGCSRVPSIDDEQISCIVADRIDSRVEWRRGCCQDYGVSVLIQDMIESELTANSAIQIALLNNPKIQTTFEELGIAQADLFEAGLLSNPAFEIEIRYPHVKGLRTNIEYLLSTSLLDIFLIPLRVKLAATDFEQTKLRVSNEILNLAFDVRETYYELIAESQKTGYIQALVELASIIAEISSKQLSIGNVNTLEFQLAQSKSIEAELELAHAHAEIVRLEEKFNKLLGFAADTCLLLPKNLTTECGVCEFDLCLLEATAIEERLDVQVARLEICRLRQSLGLKEWWTYTQLKGGLAGERELDGTSLVGPGFAAELPIFNYGQAARMRLFAELRQAQDRLSELEINVRSEVREAHKLRQSYLKIANNYRKRLLPVQQGISASSEELYNVMGIGINTLLENKYLEVASGKNYVESLKKYLIANVALDRALGGNLYKLLMQNAGCQ